MTKKDERENLKISPEQHHEMKKEAADKKTSMQWLAEEGWRLYKESQGANEGKQENKSGDSSYSNVHNDTINPRRDDPRLAQVIALFADALTEAQSIARGASDDPTVSATARITQGLEEVKSRLRELHNIFGDVGRRKRDAAPRKGNPQRRIG